MKPFAERVIDWQLAHGRHDLPWQQNRNRYRVWVSEIMLQQTQVATATPYYQRFMERFPAVADLAAAPIDDVLALWAGLGYYARARNLHKAAQQVVSEHEGELPSTVALLETLPGIGRSTAAAIVSLADGVSEPILDGNVKRVFARHAAVEGWSGKSAVLKTLWAEAECRMPKKQARAYNQGLMDLGSEICRRNKPDCKSCPVNQDCQAKKLGLVDHLPTPKPKKPVPTKTALFLCVRDSAGRVLLERRPPSGIWGGLWCLPQYEDKEQLNAALLQTADELPRLEPGKPFKHVFSHYELQAQPYHLRLGDSQKTHTIAEPNSELVALSDLKQKGMPAPIEKYLAHYFDIVD